ncbi:hypothetical protein AZI87_01565 [Bdellovibrio bacteriovorus]|uniref:DUF2892 domain-containing protein n=1 Tax=Bdellovibrio bacteriovorus TaxID=959 RepID=A0A162H449_BDEBC|nr:hypothetical protein AZI87_01565 [Bdellovibrio bacteriovorus]
MAESSSRVQLNTKPAINEKIRQATIDRLNFTGFDVDAIEQRLAELEREWDIERVIEANASSIVLAGLTLGATVNKRWFLLPAVVAGFLLQHAVQGWCPPVPVLRRLGFRTQREIDNERCILLARRGDFEKINNRSTREAIEALESNISR